MGIALFDDLEGPTASGGHRCLALQMVEEFLDVVEAAFVGQFLAVFPAPIEELVNYLGDGKTAWRCGRFRRKAWETSASLNPPACSRAGRSVSLPRWLQPGGGTLSLPQLCHTTGKVQRDSLKTPYFLDEGAGTRTQDQRIKSPLLYQLSYASGIVSAVTTYGDPRISSFRFLDTVSDTVIAKSLQNPLAHSRRPSMAKNARQ